MKRSTDLVPSFGGVGDVVSSCDDVDVPWEGGKRDERGSQRVDSAARGGTIRGERLTSPDHLRNRGKFKEADQ